mgnify:CR=1 FL=1
MIVDACSFDGCIARWEDVSDEMWSCIKFIYIDAVWIMILAMYLYEVVP